MVIRRGHLLALVCVLALAFAPTAATAAPQTTVQLALGAHMYAKPVGLTYVYGRIKPPNGVPLQQFAGQSIALYQSVFPFTVWQPLTTVTTDWEGYYSFNETITQNTVFRAIWQADPPLQSKDRLVLVPIKVTLAASPVRARKGRHVSFTGATFPPRPGALVLLQKLSRHGRFRTVTSARLGPANAYQRSWRVSAGGVYRALVRKDGQYGGGISRPVRVQAR
jgi:hypothetical protein